MKLRIVPIALALLSQACLSGPFVTEVAPIKDGRMRVRTCKVSGDAFLFLFVQLDKKDCKNQIVEPEEPAAPEKK